VGWRENIPLEQIGMGNHGRSNIGGDYFKVGALISHKGNVPRLFGVHFFWAYRPNGVPGLIMYGVLRLNSKS